MKKHRRYWDMSNKNQRIYRNMKIQISKVYNLAIHQGLITKSTGRRYMAAMCLFAKFLVECYHKMNVNYLEPKHMIAFVEQMWEAGYSMSNIETTLSAVRDFVDRVRGVGASLYLPTNEKLKKEFEEIGFRTRNRKDRIGKQRAWTVKEIEKMKEKAIELGHERYAEIIELSRAFGLRIHEAVRLIVDQLIDAKLYGHITIKGKGGLIRNIKVRNQRQIDIIEKLLSKRKKGKVFIEDEEKAHELIKKVQHFIYNHREAIQEDLEANEVFNQYCEKTKIENIFLIDKEMRRADITPHGLRHTFALEYYLELRATGIDDIAAKKIVSRELGHFRAEVTEIYTKA